MTYQDLIGLQKVTLFLIGPSLLIPGSQFGLAALLHGGYKFLITKIILRNKILLCNLSYKKNVDSLRERRCKHGDLSIFIYSVPSELPMFNTI